MTYKYDVMIVLGGTNIEDRMNLAIEGYHNEETEVVMFVGRGQGKQAARYLKKNGVPIYSKEGGKGYIVLKKDMSATTVQNAVYARCIIDEFDLGANVCICTESYHEEGALKEFRKLFPELDFNLTSKSKEVIDDSTEMFVRSGIHETIRDLLDVLYSDLPPAKTLDDVYRVYVRDHKLQKLFYDPMRIKIESPLFGLIDRSKQTPLFKAISKCL